MKTANRSSNKRESSYGMTGRAFNAEIDPLIAVIDLRKRFKALEVLKGIDLYIKQEMWADFHEIDAEIPEEWTKKKTKMFDEIKFFGQFQI